MTISHKDYSTLNSSDGFYDFPVSGPRRERRDVIVDTPVCIWGVGHIKARNE